MVSTQYHFPTPFELARTFDENLAISRQRLDEFLSFIRREGCSVIMTTLDKEILDLSEEARATWIDRNENFATIRPPDIGIHHHLVMVSGGHAYVEVKDFPQMTKYPVSGFGFNYVRRYIAIQQHFRVPIIVLWLDQERYDPALGRLNSPYRDEAGRFFPYGGLLFDMKLSEKDCLTESDFRSRERSEGRVKGPQIRWKSRYDYDDGRPPFPMMKSFSQIMTDMREGKVEMVVGDPKELPLWQYIQENSARCGRSPLVEPKEGLLYFRTRR